LRNRNYSMPSGLIFRKHYCCHCGTKLEKERTYRVVTKEDRDYHEYNSENHFPRNPVEVYSYHLKCPSCQKRVSYEEQCIIGMIQKKQGHSVLSDSEIKENYGECKKRRSQKTLFHSIFVYAIFLAVGLLVLFDPFSSTPKPIKKEILIFFVFVVIATGIKVAKHKFGHNSKFHGSYSYERKALMEKLHTYSTHNRDLINLSQKCYCFSCKAVVNREDVNYFVDDGQTAKCPKCGKEAILPDSIEENIDESVISDMNEYWF